MWKPEVDMWRPEVNMWLLSQSFSTLFFRQGLSLNLALTHMAKLVDQQAPEILLSLFSWHWDYRPAQTELSFVRRPWGIELRSMIAWQALNQVNHLSSPTLWVCGGAVLAYVSYPPTLHNYGHGCQIKQTPEL